MRSRESEKSNQLKVLDLKLYFILIKAKHKKKYLFTKIDLTQQ